jgi:hypothetical protein
MDHWRWRSVRESRVGEAWNGGEARGNAWTNDDIMARAVVMQRCGIGRSTQGYQQA